MKKSFFYLFCSMAVIFLVINCLGVKDLSPPEVNFIQNNLVISPNNDGVQDTLDFDITFKEQSFIRYWKLEIYNDKKEVVKLFESDEKLDNQINKVILPNKNIIIPRKLTWDGKDNSGKILPDGTYTFKFFAMDNKKNLTKTEGDIGMIILDTEKPEAKSTLSDTIYSPNNDGNKDKMQIKINIIKEKVDNLFAAVTDVKKDQKDDKQTWNVDIIDEKGNVIKSYTFTEKGAHDIEWDFKDEKGNLVPDGKYQVKLYSKDKGGNYWEEIQGTFTVDTKETPVKIQLKDQYSSPNGDGIKDSIGFSLDIPVMDGIVEWKLAVNDEKNKEIRLLSGKGKPDLNLEWDGKDQSNKIVEDGKYKAVFTAVYANGNVPVSETTYFFVDNTAPFATLSTSPEVFSPDGNGKQDELIIRQKTSEEELWEGLIFNEKGDIVKKFMWNNMPGTQEMWDGKDNDNKLLPDGTYFYQLVSTDNAGNKFESKKITAKIYTKDTPIFITASLPGFSPNNDKIKDEQSFEVKINKQALTTEITEWKLDIKDSSNNTVFSSGKKGDVPDILEWDGKITGGRTANDGNYYANLTITFKAGTESGSKSKLFLVDTKVPDGKVSYSPKLFSPDNDGENETVSINVEAKDESGINNWKLTILTPNKKKEFFSFEGIGNPADKIVWDGLNKDGVSVESVEDYPVKLIVEDNVGNKLEKEFPPIMVDILIIKLADGRLKVRISNINFKPDSPVMTDDPKNKNILDLLVNALKKYPQHNIIIEGHANKFTKFANERRGQRLSEQRSQTIANELTKRGISGKRLTSIGKGFDEPIIPFREGMTLEELEELAVNRRVEFYLSR